MKAFNIALFTMVSYMAVSTSFADIYEWVDENGVTHYSNYAPPKDYRVLMKTREVPYDEAADRARMAADRKERLELVRLELAQRESKLELREAEVEQRLAEADRAVDEALSEADFYREEARSSNRVLYRGGGFWCRGYISGCDNPIYDRWYYRKKLRHHNHKKYYHRRPHQRYHYGKKRYSHGRNYHHTSSYRYKSYHRPKGHYSNYKLNSRSKSYYRGKRIGTRSGGFNGRGHFSRGRAGFGRRH